MATSASACVDIGDAVCTGSSAVGSYDGATACDASRRRLFVQRRDRRRLDHHVQRPERGRRAGQQPGPGALELHHYLARGSDVEGLDIQVAADDDNDADATDGVEGGTSDDDGLINTGSEANLKDIKIIDTDTGAVVMGPLELDVTTDDASDETSLTGTAEDALQIIDFTDDWTMDAGETRNLALTADVDNGLTANETLVAIFDISGLRRRGRQRRHGCNNRNRSVGRHHR